MLDPKSFPSEISEHRFERIDSGAPTTICLLDDKALVSMVLAILVEGFRIVAGSESAAPRRIGASVSSLVVVKPSPSSRRRFLGKGSFASGRFLGEEDRGAAAVSS